MIVTKRLKSAADALPPDDKDRSGGQQGGAKAVKAAIGWRRASMIVRP